MMQKRIVYVTESGGYGGAEKYLVFLCQGAKDIYKNVTVALHFSESNYQLRAELQALGVEVLNAKYFKGLYPLNLFFALKFFRQITHANVHFSLPYITSCPLMLLAAYMLRRPYIITEHLSPPTPLAGGPYVLLHYCIFNFLKKRIYRRAKHVIAVSGQLKNILVQSYGMPMEKIHVIYNGISAPENFTQSADLRAILEIPPTNVVITNVARLDGQKGQEYLLTAIKDLIKDYPGLTVLLVGDGPKKEEILEQIQRYRLEKHVKVLGFRNDVPQILAISDMFVLPSLNEGFPFSIVEAMGAGLPVIATDVGGNAEAIVHGTTGFIIPPKNSSELCAKIKVLVADKEKRILFGTKAKEKALSDFSLTAMLEKTFGLYP